MLANIDFFQTSYLLDWVHNTSIKSNVLSSDSIRPILLETLFGGTPPHPESRYTKMPTSKRELKGSSKYYQSKLPNLAEVVIQLTRMLGCVNIGMVPLSPVAWLLCPVRGAACVSQVLQESLAEQGPKNKQEWNQMDGKTSRTQRCAGSASVLLVVYLLTKERGRHR